MEGGRGIKTYTRCKEEEKKTINDMLKGAKDGHERAEWTVNDVHEIIVREQGKR
jgi:ribosomal silencing factor RsfS